MDIDVSALRGIVRDKELSWDLVISSIEEALLFAYQRSPGAAAKARVVVDRDSGHVTVWATEEVVVDPDTVDADELVDQPSSSAAAISATARPPREFDDTPTRFWPRCGHHSAPGFLAAIT